MYFRNFILLFVLAVSAFCSIETAFSQTKEIDSLKLSLINAKEDSNKVNTLLLICNKLQGSYIFETTYIDTSIALAKKLNLPIKEFIGLSQLAQVYFASSKNTEQLKAALAALAVAKKVNSKELIAEGYIGATYGYQSMENFTEAIKNAFSGLRLYEEMNDTFNIANTWIAIGRVYSRQQNPKAMSSSFQKALKMLEPEYEKNKHEIGICYHYAGRAEMLQKNYAKAMSFFTPALKIWKEIGEKTFLAGTTFHIGLTNKGIGDSARAAGNEALAIRLYKEGLKKYFEFFNIRREFGDSARAATIYQSLGDINICLKAYSQAGKYLDSALMGAANEKNKNTYKNIYQSLYTLDSIQGNYKLAFENYKKYTQYKDSIGIEESMKKAENQTMQYEFDQKENFLKQKQIITETKLKTQKRQKYFYWIGLLILALLAFFVFLNFRNQKKINILADEAHDKEKAELELQTLWRENLSSMTEEVHSKEKAELELQSLRAQLNPHFMFNSLNAIQELILLEENEKAQSYLARFSKLLRMLLENAEKPFIPLQREIDFLQLYLSLENLRIPDLKHSIIVEPDIDTGQTAIPNMILQPYIENAIWHGLSHKKEDREVAIRITKANGVILYEIEDNGVGRKKATEMKSLFRKEHKSKGMELLSKRFKLLAKEFGSDIETTITDKINNGEVGGTLVTIKVPIEISREFKNPTS